MINSIENETNKKDQLFRLKHLFVREDYNPDLPFNLQNLVFVLKTSDIEFQSMFIEMNDLFCTLLEYSRGELLDMTLCDLMDDDCEVFLEEKQKKILEEEPMRYKISLNKKFGGKIDLVVESCVFKSEDSIVEFAVAWIS